MREHRPRDWRGAAAWLAAELFIVFIGVYGAGALAAWQDGRARDARRRQVERALLAEMRDIVQQGHEHMSTAGLGRYVDAIRSGARPALVPISSYVPYRPDVWKGVLQSGGLELLDPDRVVRLARYFGQAELLLELFRRLDDYQRTVLLPNLGKPSEEFYGPAGQLRPKYHWFLEFLTHIEADVPDLLEQAEALGGELAADLGEPFLPDDEATGDGATGDGATGDGASAGGGEGGPPPIPDPTP